MSVTNAKHVRVVALLEVGVENEAVLVLFVRVSGHVADLVAKAYFVTMFFSEDGTSFLVVSFAGLPLVAILMSTGVYCFFCRILMSCYCWPGSSDWKFWIN